MLLTLKSEVRYFDQHKLETALLNQSLEIMNELANVELELVKC